MSKIEQSQERTRALRKILREGRQKKAILEKEIANWQSLEKQEEQKRQNILQALLEKFRQQERSWQDKLKHWQADKEEREKEKQKMEQEQSLRKQKIASLQKEKDDLQNWLKKAEPALTFSQKKIKALLLTQKKSEEKIHNLEMAWRQQRVAMENKLQTYPIFRKQKEVTRRLEELAVIQQRKQREEKRLDSQLKTTFQEDLKERVEEDLAKVKREEMEQERQKRDLESKRASLAREANSFSLALKQDEARQERAYHLNVEKEKENLTKTKNNLLVLEREVEKQRKEREEKKTRLKLLETALNREQRDLAQITKTRKLFDQKERLSRKQQLAFQQALKNLEEEKKRQISRLQQEEKRAKGKLQQKIRQNQLKIRQINQKLQHAKNEMEKALGKFWQELHQELHHEKGDNL